MSEPDVRVADGEGGAGATGSDSGGSPSHGATENSGGTDSKGPLPGGGSGDGEAGEGATPVAGSTGASQGGMSQGGEPGAGSAGTPSEPVAGIGNGGTGTVDVDPCDGSDEAACADAITGVEGTFGALKSSWFLTGCKQKSDYACLTSSNCPAGGLKWTQSFPIGGVVGANYSITFDFRGLAEGRYYTGGTYDGALGVDPNANTNDGFYIGGSPGASNYDVWQLRVLDAQGNEVQHYYLNAFPNQGYESHRTFLLSYTKSILVVGGGTVELAWADLNCRSIDNCNAGDVVGTTCTMPRKLPSPDQNLQVPAAFVDPEDGQMKGYAALSAAYSPASRAQPWHSQLGHLTVTAAEFAGN